MTQFGATRIVSGAEVHAILIINVLRSFSTRATLFVVATEQRRVPNVSAMNKAIIWVTPNTAQNGAVANVSGVVAASVVYAK